MDPNMLRQAVIVIVGLVTAALLIKALFFPSPLDILALFALILALFALFDFDIFGRRK
ncbi:MAG: hypothetical protein QME79_04485 [Bacillota bacterium]|nr:hypothetical protein [Bacillota bacterium]